MDNFWKNILRYPRFFITSLAGLILIILTPFQTLFKVAKLRIFAIFLALLLIFSLYVIIRYMTNL